LLRQALKHGVRRVVLETCGVKHVVSET
jgi:hypothetical protein